MIDSLNAEHQKGYKFGLLNQFEHKNRQKDNLMHVSKE
jgi:hypothetical protein